MQGNLLQRLFLVCVVFKVNRVWLICSFSADVIPQEQ
jgi:hypothetical protein